MIIYSKKKLKGVAGSRFVVQRDSHGKGSMKWKTSQSNHDKPQHIPFVINFILELLLIGDNTDGVVKGFTEHNRELNGTSFKFRAHPSY